MEAAMSDKGKIPEGYKQTEIGIIPEDWDIKKLGEIGEIEMCKRIFKEQTSVSGDIPFYKIGTFGSVPDAFISHGLYNEFKERYSFPRIGSILFSAAGTIGRTVIYDGKPAYFQDSNIVWIDNDEKLIFNKFLYYYFNVIEWASAYGGTVIRLYNEYIRNTLIPFPPLSEQHAIAEVLSDIDNYITALEKLIAKKKAIKQGIMQELITGKRRLPGFTGEWTSINLTQKSILKARIGWQGLTTAEYRNDGYAFLITGTDFLDGRINWISCHFVDKSRYDQDTNIQIKNDDVLITKDGTIGKVALVEGLTKNATLNSGIFVIRPINHAYDNLFVYFILTSKIFINFLAKLSAGSTINHLYQKDFVDFEFLAPPTIEEQKASAQILLDMDAEIEALTAKLNKAKLIKRGMMRELLSGRIRLVKPEAAINIAKEPETAPLEKVAATLPKSHNQQIDDAVMIAAIVDAFYSDEYPLGRKKTQKLLYLLRRHQDESTVAFKKKAAGPYADEVRYKGGEPIAIRNKYITTTTTKGKGTIFGRGENIMKAIDYINHWNKRKDIQWLIDNFHYTGVDDLELLATVDMAICDLEETGIFVKLENIKHLIATNVKWKAKLNKKTFADSKIIWAIKQLSEIL
jgi:type I restriction enzyme S subunit